MQNKKIVMAIALVMTIAVGFFAVGYHTARTDIFIESQIGATTGITDENLESHPKSDVHCTIRIYKDGEEVLNEYHSGALTDLGDSWLAVKWTNDANYNQTRATLYGVYVSIGNQGTLNTASTVLPAEWNRTTGAVEDTATSSFNLTCTIYPDTGPYTADCIGINLENNAGGNDLVAYDTFNEVTGIDDTFTINIEFQVTISHT